jgi:hypothetical protein
MPVSTGEHKRNKSGKSSGSMSSPSLPLTRESYSAIGPHPLVSFQAKELTLDTARTHSRASEDGLILLMPLR